MEERLAPVIGANAIPAPVAPGTGFDGVVQLSQGCTGSLLTSGRHILTAAHCVTDGAGVVNVPNTGVLFQLPGKNITINVPQANYWVHPGWNGSAANGNDVAVLRLPVLAPGGPAGVGAERYPLQTAADEVNQTFRVVGYGRTGTGMTGNANAGGVKRSGQNIWTTTSNTLRNEVQAVSRTGAPTGGTFRLTFSGQTTGNIPHNATAAQVQSALEALSNLAVGDVNVEGGPALNTPWFVGFRGGKANQNVPQMTFIDNIVGGGVSVATRYQGASEAPLFGALAYDFDNGNARNDALGLMYGLAGLGLGANEASQSQGDSGGPAFLDNRISGIVSYSLPLNPGTPPDVDGVANNTFGELGVMTRVSSYAGAINAQMNGAYTLVLDMDFQHAGNNGGADTIEVTRFGNSLLLRVNGNLIHSDALADITSVLIIGSNDRDIITVGGDLGKLVNVQGSAGNDELIVTGTAGNDTISVTATQVQIGGTIVPYSSVELVRVNLLAGNDVINVFGTAAGTPVIADGGADNDTITVGSAANSLATVLGNVTVLGGSDTTQDVLNLDDQGNAAARTFTLTNSSVTWAGGPTITYGTVERLTLNAGTNNDIINIQSTAAATPVTVNAGAGNDTVNVGSAANTLAGLQGALAVNGQAGVDTLNVRDQGSPGSHDYFLTATAVTRGGVPGAVNYSGLEGLTLRGAAAGNNAYWVAGTAAGAPVSVFGGAGDYLARTAGASTWSITGADAGTLTGAGMGAALSFTGCANLLGGPDNDRFVFADGQGISGYLDGGAGLNTLDYSAWTSGVYVDLYNFVATGALLVVNLQNVVGGFGDDYLHGDGQANVLVGNDGHDILVGDEGADRLNGGAGADQLYGGGGADRLEGGAGEDLLIDGWTAYDYDVTALSYIWLEWTRQDGPDYYARIDNLRYGTGFSPYVLDGGSVFSDFDVDELLGGSELDWFWATEGFDSLPDRIFPDETVN